MKTMPFNDLLTRLISLLNHSGLYLGSAIDDLESLDGFSIDYVKGFVRCLACNDSIKELLEDNPFFDRTFNEILDYPVGA